MRKKKKTVREIIGIILLTIGGIIGNVVVHGVLTIIMALPLVDYQDGYLELTKGKLIFLVIYEITLALTQLDLLLMTIQGLIETIFECFIKKLYLGLPWNYFLSIFTIGLWTGDLPASSSSTKG